MSASRETKNNRSFRTFLVPILVIVGGSLVCCLPASYIYMMFTGTYDIETVSFKLTDPATATSGADGSLEPGVWIDTNTSISLFSRQIQSSKPYSIGIDKADTSFTYASVEFTTVQITYDDGTVETSKPTLPLIINATDFTATNGVGGSQIVQTKMRLISGKIPGVITRDEPFTLILEGHFNLDDGSKVPFKIEQPYDVEIIKTTEKAKDVFRDI